MPPFIGRFQLHDLLCLAKLVLTILPPMAYLRQCPDVRGVNERLTIAADFTNPNLVDHSPLIFPTRAQFRVPIPG